MLNFPVRSVSAVLALAAAAMIWSPWSVTTPKVSAAPVVYDIVLKASTSTLDKTKSKNKSTGQMTFDSATGDFSFTASEDTDAGIVDFVGTGQMGAGPKTAYAVTTFDVIPRGLSTPISSGTAIFTGKFTKGATKFKGKFQVVTPNGVPLLPVPNGFTFTTGKVTGVIADMQPQPVAK